MKIGYNKELKHFTVTWPQVVNGVNLRIGYGNKNPFIILGYILTRKISK